MNNIFSCGDFLLPQNVEMKKWSVIACDQYSSQKEYWDKVKKNVGDSPSTLNLIIPEYDLADIDDKVLHINEEMIKTKEHFVRYNNSFIYVERTLISGTIRKGIVGVIDLEEYDYNDYSATKIRPTEKTVIERIPPRTKLHEIIQIKLFL